MKLYQITAAIGLVTVAASVAHAQSPDPRAAEAMQLFGAFCISTAGTPDRALAVLGNGNALATRLPDNIVRNAQGGQEGGVGWAVRSPSDAELMLDYNPQGICGLRIRQADEASVRDAFKALVDGVASGTGSELTSEPSEIRTVNGVQTTYTAYSLPLGGRTAHLALTTTEQPIGEQQHFMTFGFVK